MLLVQRPHPSKGIAIVFSDKLPAGVDKALPEWTILVTDSSPQTTAELQVLRRYSGGNAETPLLLIGEGNRSRAIWHILHSNIPGSYGGAALLNAPEPAEREKSTWRTWGERMPILNAANPEELVRLLEDLTKPGDPE